MRIGPLRRYFLTLLWFTVRLAATSSNVPAAFTGGFGEPACTQCHSGQLNPPGGNVAVSGPGVYAGGMTYTLQVTVNDPGAAAWSFQLSARFTNGNQAGAFPTSSTVAVRTASWLGYQVQYAAPVSPLVQTATEARFNLAWNAPPDAAGGEVVVSVVGMAANRDNTTNGDRTYIGETRLASGPPQVNSGGVVSAASFQSSVSPGQLISVFGKNLTTGGPYSAAATPLPFSLGTTQVILGGLRCPLIYVSTTQINLQLPSTFLPGAQSLSVMVNQTPGSPEPVTIAAVAPALFTVNSTGVGAGAILHADYAPVAASRPAVVGETVLIFGTGLGTTSPAVADGAPAPALSRTLETVSVNMGGHPAVVSYSGLAPGFAGLYQINAVVPAVSGIVEIMATVSAVTSRSRVTIQIQ